MLQLGQLVMISVALLGIKPTDACGWSVGGPEERDCPHYDSRHWRCLASLMDCKGEKDYHCAKDLKGKWTETCDEVKLCHEGQEPQIVDGKVFCGKCQDPERYNVESNTPSNKFSQCPLQKTRCEAEINGKVECDEPYSKHDPDSKYKMDRKCRCAYEKNRIPRFYNFEKDLWRCTRDQDLICDYRPCDTKDGAAEIRGEDYRCHPVKDDPVSSTKTTIEYIFSGITRRPIVSIVTPEPGLKAAESSIKTIEKTTEKMGPDKEKETTPAPRDELDKATIAGIADIIILIILVIGMLVIGRLIKVYLIKNPKGNSETDFQPYQKYQKVETGPVKESESKHPKPTTSPEVEGC